MTDINRHSGLTDSELSAKVDSLFSYLDGISCDDQLLLKELKSRFDKLAGADEPIEVTFPKLLETLTDEALGTFSEKVLVHLYLEQKKRLDNRYHKPKDL